MSTNDPPAAPALVLLMTVATVLAGCTAGPVSTDTDPWAGAPDLDFATMAVQTTATEPWELQGFIHVAWGDEVFIIDAEKEDDLPRYLVRAPATVYVSETRMGWIATPLEEALTEGAVSNRVLLWDLRMLLGHGALDVDRSRSGTDTVYEVTGALRYGGSDLVLDARVDATDGNVVRAAVTAPDGRESPYTFAGATEEVSFPVALPPMDAVLDRATVTAQDSVASEGHAEIITLLRSYARNHAGGLPEDVTPQSLQVEMLASGASWPENPYDGVAMEASLASGHFSWERCATDRGHYEGFGWDGTLVEQSFGAGCDDS